MCDQETIEFKCFFFLVFFAVNFVHQVVYVVFYVEYVVFLLSVRLQNY